ncbi:MAG: S8 family serine peptidase [Phycisphaerae bacterium]|nr:S8 family serine peptidase [Phycisphaerae bacterium]
MKTKTTVSCRIVVAVIVAWGWGVASVRAQGIDVIRWKAGDLAKAGPEETNPDVVLAVPGDRHVVVRLAAIPSAQEREAMAAEGIQLLRYLGDNAFFARISGGEKAANDAKAAGVTAACGIQAEWKQAPMILRGQFPAYARGNAPAVGGRVAADGENPDGEIDAVALCVLLHPDVDVDLQGSAAITRHGGQVRGIVRSINMIMACMPAANVAALAAEDVVQWVEPPLPPLGPTNDSNRVLTQADVVQAAPYSLTGAGVNVLVFDAGKAHAAHQDFGGRLTTRDDSSTIDHATHVAGTIGGSGARSGGQYRGMAPGVTMQSYGIEPSGWLTPPDILYTNPGDIEQDYEEAINTYGAEIANNSIGTNVAHRPTLPCEWEGDYGTTSQLIDSIVRGSLGAPMRVIFANGNERGNTGRCGTSYHTTAPPACAKNHITVGAVNSNDDSMTDFSSWGPTDDGRLKPDIVAPGCQSDGDNGVTSTSSNGGYVVMCGTSMATPTVTGLCALLLETYKYLYIGDPLPLNSTLKVLLAHNAVDLGNPGPDYKFGYGSVRIQDTITFMYGEYSRYLTGSVDQDGEAYYFVEVPAGATELKVTMAWDDPPGAVNTTPELVNDLDLVAISPGGASVHYPWTLDPGNGDAPAIRTQRDDRNNIEQVVVDAPAAGVWTIKVIGYAVPEGPQTYSLAATPAMFRPTPPVATHSFCSAVQDTTVAIELQATDDGIPDPPGALTSVITSLPQHGSLSDPYAGTISAVPYALAAGGSIVRYTPDPGYIGPDRFTHKANDGGLPYWGGDSREATVSIILTMALSAPVLAPEPEMTNGTSNTVDWSGVPEADRYLVQCAQDSGFTQILSTSNWVSELTHAFAGLTLCQTYWYRVQARSPQPSTTEVVGSGSLTANCSDLGFTTFVDCKLNRTLTEIQQYLEITTSQTIEFAVYERPSSGPFQRVYHGTISSGTGTRWYGSGPISVPMVAGRAYCIAMAMSGAAKLYYRFDSGETVLSWGIKKYGGNTTYPLPTSLSQCYEHLGHYQRLITSNDGISPWSNVESSTQGPCYQLTVTEIPDKDGDVDVSPPGPYYAAGTQVSLDADPDPFYHFDHWLIYDQNHPGDANYADVATGNPLVLTMNRDYEVDAYFECGAGAGQMLPMLIVGLMISALRFHRTVRTRR